MLSILTAASFLLLGCELSARLWRGADSPVAPVERAAAAVLLGMSLWLASIWALALSYHLVRDDLIARTGIVAVGALALFALRKHEKPRWQWPIVAALVPLIAWTLFILWRGWVVPPLSHDALGYHLPKAVLYARSHGFDYFDFLPETVRKLPANYELMLSDFLILDGSDRITEWLSTIFYLGVIVASAALVHRWWQPGGIALTVVALLVGASPVALLHSGAHKNDLMTAFFMIEALVFAGRYISTGETRSLALCVASVVAATGTKPQAALLGLMLLPILMWRFARGGGLDIRRLSTVAAVIVTAVLLLGGIVFGMNFIHERQLRSDAPATQANSIVTYGDWSNVWQGPFVLLTAPFSPWDDDIWVPWEKNTWFWKRHEIYFSHLGVPFAICAVLLPIAITKFRSRDSIAAQRERLLITAAAFATFLIVLPVHFDPHGLYAISLPRYVFFLMPVTLGWTVAPILRGLSTIDVCVTMISLVLAALGFTSEAIDNAVRDRFCPLKYVIWASHHPGTREIPCERGRAATIVDRLAGPTATIAVDGDFLTWIYPAFGAQLQRRIEFIRTGLRPPRIPPDAKWIIIDRQLNIRWRHPDYVDLSEWRKFQSRGFVKHEDLLVFDSLRRDPRFRLVYYYPTMNQAVFERTGG